VNEESLCRPRFGKVEREIEKQEKAKYWNGGETYEKKSAKILGSLSRKKQDTGIVSSPTLLCHPIEILARFILQFQ